MESSFLHHHLSKVFTVFICLSLLTACVKEDPAGSSGNTSGNTNNNNNNNNTNNTSNATVTNPDTYFIDQFRTFNTLGNWWVQEFTVSGTSAQFVLRGASTYAVDFAVVPAAQINNFKNNASFTGYGVMDNKFGTQYLTLPPGTYYAAVRNQVNAANGARIELDKRITLPASDRASYVDLYFSGANNVNANGWLVQPFTIQAGYRYFVDGCNSGDISSYVIPEADINKFKNGQSFNHYPAYQSSSTADPGHFELKLAPGNYAYAFRNTGSKAQALTYACERWRVQ